MKKLPVVLVCVLLLSLFAGCVGKTQPPETVVQTTAASAAAKPHATTEAPATTETPATTEASVTTVPQTTAAPETEPVPESTETPDAAEIHPMLFHVTGEDGREMYLFGTIHAGDERTGTVLEKLTPYLERCDALAVEFDILAYENDLEAQLKDAVRFIATDGTTVEDHMPAELYERASVLLAEANLRPDMMRIYNLAMWSQLVEQAALLTRCSLSSDCGMDRQLIQFCYGHQIPVRDVESVELQFGLLAGFSDELNLLLIENVLDNLEDYGSNLDALYSTWLEGDYDAVLAFLSDETADEEAELTEEQKALVEEYNDEMLTQRNLGMRDRAVEWMQAGDKVFFAVGAAHLVDEDGLAALLRAAGYTVEQLEY